MWLNVLAVACCNSLYPIYYSIKTFKSLVYITIYRTYDSGYIYYRMYGVVV